MHTLRIIIIMITILQSYSHSFFVYSFRAAFSGGFLLGFPGFDSSLWLVVLLIFLVCFVLPVQMSTVVTLCFVHFVLYVVCKVCVQFSRQCQVSSPGKAN